jgi:DNA-binding MarR family transcriptional regulator
MQFEYYRKLKEVFSQSEAQTRLGQLNQGVIDTTVVVPKKLSSTSIVVLLYLLKMPVDGTFAKSIESDLQLNKATVSYNIKILEENSLIERDITTVQEDQRFKKIKINKNGLNFLFTFYQQLSSYFTLPLSSEI